MLANAIANVDGSASVSHLPEGLSHRSVFEKSVLDEADGIGENEDGVSIQDIDEIDEVKEEA
jgi:hypothetical protein